MSQKVCLITPGHIASNPRLVKEASSLLAAGYSVHIIFTQYMDYLTAEDFKILKSNPNITFSKLNWTKKNLIRRIYLGIIQKLAIHFSTSNNIFHKIIINRSYPWQYKEAIKIQAHLYIAHNLAALPIAVNAAKINNAKCGFDAEDFHRQEISNDINSVQYSTASFIENKYLPQVNYITVASPLIYDQYKLIYPNLFFTTINNVFSKNFLQKLNPSVPNRPLKLFWFSQTIGKGRGLEDVIFAINHLKELAIELHLLGNISNIDKDYFDNLSAFNINYIAPISGDNIFKLANTFDIGLALEPAFCLNNNIALSNKIFTYLQAGLAVVASETAAQKKFLQENSNIGVSYRIGDIASLAQIIKTYDRDRELLNSTKQNALQLAEMKYNWEVESKKFLKIVEETLSN